MTGFLIGSAVAEAALLPSFFKCYPCMLGYFSGQFESRILDVVIRKVLTETNCFNVLLNFMFYSFVKLIRRYIRF